MSGFSILLSLVVVASVDWTVALAMAAAVGAFCWWVGAADLQSYCLCATTTAVGHIHAASTKDCHAHQLGGEGRLGVAAARPKHARRHSLARQSHSPCLRSAASARLNSR